MPRVDFSAGLKTAEREGLIGGGDTFKFKEGANRFRVLSECLPHQGSYQGKPNFKWLCYVLDRADGQLKKFFMPHTIYKQIVELQKSDDYGFEEVPMPYDLTVTAKGAGTKEVEYTLTPARKNSDLTSDELAKLAQAKPLKELQEAIRAKAEPVTTSDGPPPAFDPEEMPF